MRKRKLIITRMAVAMFAVPSAAMADTSSTTFEAPTFAAGSWAGQLADDRSAGHHHHQRH
jgi:hypothetical protein